MHTVRHLLANLYITLIFCFFSLGWLKPIDHQTSDSDIIIQDKLRSLNKYREPNSVETQKTLLQEFLKKQSNKKYSPNSYVVPEINLEGKFEKFTSLKVSIPMPYFERALCQNSALYCIEAAAKNRCYEK